MKKINPPPPDAALVGKEFECPSCHGTMQIESIKDYRLDMQLKCYAIECPWCRNEFVPGSAHKPKIFDAY